MPTTTTGSRRVQRGARPHAAGRPLTAVVVVLLLAVTVGQACAPTVTSFAQGATTVAPSTGAASPAVAATRGGDLLSSGFFPIGVDVQPSSNFDVWKSRGVNTLVRVPEGHDVEGWAQAANAAGLYQIRPPRRDPAADLADVTLLAWSHPDEPDGIHSQVPYAKLQADHARWKRIDPTRTVFVNFIGGLNQYDLSTGEGGGDNWYRKYVAAADWISSDTYPVNERKDLSELGRSIDHLRVISGGKPVFAYIETTDYAPTAGGPGPTPDQLRAEIWSAIIHGARGIWYFPVTINPFAFDTTPPAVVAEMVEQNARVTSLSGVLQREIDPAGVRASAASPLEVGWRVDPSGTYVIALNLSASAQQGARITLNGVSASSARVHDEARSVPIANGVITDSFGPYAVHVYQIPRPTALAGRIVEIRQPGFVEVAATARRCEVTAATGCP